MRFRQPLVLLLGSVMSASSIGCSAVTAIISDSRPVNRANRSDADRLTAIGRVFENQGRYDQAEVMYRKALRNRPQDFQIRNQLQQIAARRKEQKFGPAGTANAIAKADNVSPPKSGVLQVHETVNAKLRVSAKPSTPPSSKSRDVTSIAAATFVPQQQQQTKSVTSLHEALPVAPVDLPKPNATPEIELASGGGQGWRSSRHHLVKSDDLLAALERPDDHIDMLLEGLSSGENVETKSLAATLLGDCDPSNTLVRNTLIEHQNIQSDPEVLIAICDSQIERGESDRQTVNCLVHLCTRFTSETQVQAASQLRNFAGTEHESSCLTTLNELLTNAEPDVRAISAATLGDFSPLETNTLTQLQKLADADASSNVRDAAQAALTRQRSDGLQIVPRLTPKSKW